MSSLVKILEPFVKSSLKLRVDEFEKKSLFDLKIGISSYKIIKNPELNLFYKYFLFGCYLICNQLKSENKLSHHLLHTVKKFNLDSDENLVEYYFLIYLDNVPSDILNNIPQNLYGINIKIRNVNLEPPINLNSTTIEEIIENNLKIPKDEFEKCNLMYDLPIQFRMYSFFDKNSDDNKQYKYFMVSHYFIEKYLERIENYKKHSMGNHERFDVEYEKKVDAKSNQQITKKIYCNFLMAPDELIKKIPDKLLNIDIRINNTTNTETKIEFGYGTFNKNNDKISSVSSEITINIFEKIEEKQNKKKSVNFIGKIMDMLYKKPDTNINNKIALAHTNDEIMVSYYGNADDRHTIKLIDDSIIFTETQYHNKGDCMRYCVGTGGKKIFPKKDYKWIIFRHNHVIT
jgi:hypothetical protein